MAGAAEEAEAAEAATEEEEDAYLRKKNSKIQKK
jgi:hypothetical protein